MRYPNFIAHNIIGGVLWSVSVPLAGFFLRRVIPNLDRYILLIISLVLVVSLIPVAWELVKHRRRRA